MDKLHKYAQKYCDGEVIVSSNGNSYYYHFNKGKFILRISDHIGRNSDGKVSIVIDKNGYLLHNHNTGAVYIETYEHIKEFIRSLAIFSSVNIKMETASMGDLNNEIHTLKQQMDSLTKKNTKLGETNTRLNNENTTHKGQVKSLKKEVESLRNEMLNHPIRFWFKLFFRHLKAKK
jgi:cell division protein FtsB